jgi:osmotically-inducible protein OsmY
MMMGIKRDTSKGNLAMSNFYPNMNRIFRAALAAVVVSGAVACAMGPPKTAAERQADSDTADRVTAALNADSTLFARHITVRADRGVVDLSGYVWTPVELSEAVQTAETVRGVTKVVNRMEVDRGAVSDSSVTR